jgi:hypothetical protein
MVDYTKDPIKYVKDILWAELLSNEILDDNDYLIQGTSTKLVPIIPVQQQQEFVEYFSDAPFIVYDTDIIEYDTDWWICKERVYFTIYSNSYSKMREISFLILDLFRRFDESARDIDNYSRNEENYASSAINDGTFIYHYFAVQGISETYPSEEEAGRYANQIDIVMSYSRNVGATGRFA